MHLVSVLFFGAGGVLIGSTMVRIVFSTDFSFLRKTINECNRAWNACGTIATATWCTRKQQELRGKLKIATSKWAFVWSEPFGPERTCTQFIPAEFVWCPRVGKRGSVEKNWWFFFLFARANSILRAQLRDICSNIGKNCLRRLISRSPDHTLMTARNKLLRLASLSILN